MNLNTVKEFKPTIIFLAKFLGLYFVGNLLYGAFITYHRPDVDPITHLVSAQSAMILSGCGAPVTYRDYDDHLSTLILNNGRTVLSVYEGCNGLNIMIIFVSFMIAFGPLKKTMLWFIPLGLLMIYVASLLRILFLYFVARQMPEYMYFTHKYLLTAVLFALVFVLWLWWIQKFAKRKNV
jgi:exosortase family protein XrtF